MRANGYKDFIRNVEVYGLQESMFASGYPMMTKPPTETDFEFECLQPDKHIKRSTKLAQTKTGEGHDNWLNGIVAQFDLEFTVKAWTEAQRYHFLDFVSSFSTMHRLSKFDLDKAYIKYVNTDIVEIMKRIQREYNENPTQEKMWELLYSNPCGMKLTARMTTNYRQLKTIYHQRKNHRLKYEWCGFCEWIESLPCANELIIRKDNVNE